MVPFPGCLNRESATWLAHGFARGMLCTQLIAAFQFIYKWGAEQWAAFGTLAAVVVALIGSAQARADARREIAANELAHQKDVERLQRQHRESLAHAARLHKEELERAERRHAEILSREHVRDQIAAASEVAREIGSLMLPLTTMCNALEDLSRNIGRRSANGLGAEVDFVVNTYNLWTEKLLVFDSKLISAEMIVTNSDVVDVLRQMKQQEAVLGQIIEAQQKTILLERERGDVSAIRDAYGQLATLLKPLRKAVATSLRPVFSAG